MANNKGMSEFVRAYLACGLQLSEEEEPALAPLSTHDLPQSLVDMADSDCKLFTAKASLAGLADYVSGEVDGYSEDQAAYDFWLTRNGHGAGFWDRGLGKAGDRLTTIAQEEFTECTLYVGDDGLPYYGQ